MARKARKDRDSVKLHGFFFERERELAAWSEYAYYLGEVLGRVLSWENFNVQLPQQDTTGIAKWWEEAASKVPKQD